MGVRPLAVLALVALVGASAFEQPASALPDSTTDPAPSAKKKKKKRAKKKRKRCKKTQVRVRSGKRRTCVAARKVLPKPRAGDPRLLVAKSAYRDWSKLRNRRGKRAKSLPKLVRKLGPRAKRLLTSATAQGVARLDQMIAGASASRRAPPARATAGGCTEIPRGARDQSSFTSSDGGTQATVTSTLGADGAAIGLELSGNGFTVKADMDFGACEPNEVEAPQCPTAVGRLQGELRYKLRVSVSVSKGGEDVWSQAHTVTRKTKLDGFTDVDAKLDDLDISDEEVSNVNLGGSVRGFPPIGIRTRLIRNTRVNMRTGNYEPGLSDITVTVSMDGLYGADRSEIQDDLERRGRADADQQFRTIVDKAISAYRNRETAWQEPDKCAKLEFNPAKNSLTLRRRDTGQLTVIARAIQDGGASELDARLTSPVNATFAPTRAGGQQARFGYTVLDSATSGKVSVAVHATSKAGVAGKGRPADTWEQPLAPPFEINEIEGDFGGDQALEQPSGGISNISWTGGGTFERSPEGDPGASGYFTLTAGSVSYTFSGAAITGEPCDMAGSAFVDIPTHGGGDLSVSAVGDPAVQGPHHYMGGVFLGPSALVTLTLSNCDDEEMNGDTRVVPVSQGGQAPFDTQFQQSPDGVDYSGSRTLNSSGNNVTWTWDLTGSE